MTAGDRMELAEWVRVFALQATRDDALEEFVRVVDDRIASQVPEIASDPMLLDDLHNSTRSQWRTFAAALPQHHKLTLPAGADELARSLARRGLDLSVLLKVYRAAHRAVFAFIAEATEDLAESDPPKDTVLRFLWSRAEQWMDDSVEALIETFYAERQELLEGAMLRRSQLVEALLRGTVTDADAASVELSHPLNHWQVGFVLWAPAAGEKTQQHLAQLATQAARAIGAARPVLHPSSGRELCCWAATPVRPDLEPLSDLIADLDKAGAQVSIGSPARGIAGFRTSHDEARAAQRLCLGATRPTSLVRYDDVDLLCLVGEQNGLLDRFVVREVGALIGPDRNLTLIRETLLVFLSTGLNYTATASRLFVHKNTVRYRLARAEELLGRPLTERSAHLELALRYTAFFGPPVSRDS
ncbi:DNA-binding transcriptional regulator, PucR family [Nocardioides sp. YR527]|uniref:PucR family transcriptional regulator n=1 Tax=Nocardioides sp. YR527 TaxID=1881028 RepID=UPI00088823FA|nr:PucR family transcriptional regulator [Nocardioides sp. YR527]SDK72675.1 DNA-binding transcriptional regulator, PucR family [Nocardioides sp. YR527]